MPTDDNETQLMTTEEKKNANKCLFWSSIMGLVFSITVLTILIIMFFTYEMFLIKQVNPTRFDLKNDIQYDQNDGTCKEKYETVFPLMRFNLTRKDDLYGVYKSIGPFKNLFHDEYDCDCARDRILSQQQITFLQNNENKKLRVCNYLCNFKNEDYENIDGHGYDALTGTEIESKMIGLRPDDLLINTTFEQEFFYEVCMEHFEEWTDYQDRKCDTCAEDYYSYRTLINTTVSSDGKECIKPFRKLVEKKRIQPRQYKRCTTCTKNSDKKNDPCYSHALCSYMTDGKASVAVFRGSDAYCVKPGCTNTEHFDGSNSPSLIDLGRKYENSRQIYATYFITFCFGIVYSICTLAFWIVRLINGYELCNRAEYEKKNIAKKNLIGNTFESKKQLKMELEKEKRNLSQENVNENREKKLQGSGYSSYVSACLLAFIYAHILQGFVFLALTTVITFIFIAPHNEIAQEVQNKDLVCDGLSSIDCHCPENSNTGCRLTYFGQMNPLFTSKAGTIYDLYGWTLALWVFTVCLFVTDMAVGGYLFTRKENKFNLKDAIIKTFFNKRGDSILKSILKRKLGDVPRVQEILSEVKNVETQRKKESVRQFKYQENEAGDIEMTDTTSNSNLEENLRHRVNIRF